MNASCPRLAIIAASATLAACASSPPRLLATANLAEAFSQAEEVCGKFVPAMLHGDEDAITAIARAYGDNGLRPILWGKDVGWRNLMDAAGYGNDIRGYVFAGHSQVRTEYRLYYRISYFKSGELRSNLVKCGVYAGDGGGISISFGLSADHDVLRQLAPTQDSTTDRPERS
ncbi:MAG: hypothetical protein ACKO1J_10355 [Tagaea sp.]